MKKNITSEVLSVNELDAYNILLECGPSYLGQICKKSKIKRSTLLDAFKKLEKKNADIVYSFTATDSTIYTT